MTDRVRKPAVKVAKERMTKLDTEKSISHTRPEPTTKPPTSRPPACPVDGDTICKYVAHDNAVIAILTRIVDACYDQGGTIEPWRSIRADIEKLTT
jgi:hypothetical protein